MSDDFLRVCEISQQKNSTATRENQLKFLVGLFETGILKHKKLLRGSFVGSGLMGSKVERFLYMGVNHIFKGAVLK